MSPSADRTVSVTFQGGVYSQNQRDILETKDIQGILVERQGGGLTPAPDSYQASRTHRKQIPSVMNHFREYALGRDKDAWKPEIPETKCLVITS